jgi:PAS domain S-box-containing protein
MMSMSQQAGAGSGDSEFARTILEASPDALIAVSPHGNVLYWNAAAETMFGYAAGEAIGRSMFDLIVPADQLAEAREQLAAAAIAAGATSHEAVRRTKACRSRCSG